MMKSMSATGCVRGVLALMCVVAVSAFAQAPANTGIEVRDAWVRLLPPTVKTTAGYLIIDSSQEDRLIKAHSVMAERVELHLSEMKDGMMSMAEVAGVPIVAGRPTQLSPGGYHLMIMGLKQPLTEGELFPIELTFDQAGIISIQAEILSP